MSTVYQDLDLNFSANPLTGDVSISYDKDSINKNLRYLILTQNGEVPYNPSIGCQVHGLMFEILDQTTLTIMKRTIENTINKFEPRVSLNYVDVTAGNNQNSVKVVISYYIVVTSTEVTFTTYLTKAR